MAYGHWSLARNSKEQFSECQSVMHTSFRFLKRIAFLVMHTMSLLLKFIFSSYEVGVVPGTSLVAVLVTGNLSALPHNGTLPIGESEVPYCYCSSCYISAENLEHAICWSNDENVVVVRNPCTNSESPNLSGGSNAWLLINLFTIVCIPHSMWSSGYLLLGIPDQVGQVQ